MVRYNALSVVCVGRSVMLLSQCLCPRRIPPMHGGRRQRAVGTPPRAGQARRIPATRAGGVWGLRQSRGGDWFTNAAVALLRGHLVLYSTFSGLLEGRGTGRCQAWNTGPMLSPSAIPVPSQRLRSNNGIAVGARRGGMVAHSKMRSGCQGPFHALEQRFTAFRTAQSNAHGLLQGAPVSSWP